MKSSAFIFLTLIFAGAISAGCIQGLTATPAPTPVQTSEVTPTPTIPLPQPSFSMGDHYLKKTYVFQSEKQIYTEEIRVDTASWGIGFDVLPLTDNLIPMYTTGPYKIEMRGNRVKVDVAVAKRNP
jgi:hypothetical protein